LIAFENLLKVDSWLTINRLIQSNIDPKMITGDNIYIAVETARRAGIINMDDKVIFLEGSRNILHIDEEEKE
jgi:magnesium-transporting ATPase (P-type)